MFRNTPRWFRLNRWALLLSALAAGSAALPFFCPWIRDSWWRLASVFIVVALLGRFAVKVFLRYGHKRETLRKLSEFAK